MSCRLKKRNKYKVFGIRIKKKKMINLIKKTILMMALTVAGISWSQAQEQNNVPAEHPFIYVHITQNGIGCPSTGSVSGMWTWWKNTPNGTTAYYSGSNDAFYDLSVAIPFTVRIEAGVVQPGTLKWVELGTYPNLSPNGNNGKKVNAPIPYDVILNPKTCVGGHPWEIPEYPEPPVTE
jgi:hypothetical protein